MADDDYLKWIKPFAIETWEWGDIETTVLDLTPMLERAAALGIEESIGKANISMWEGVITIDFGAEFDYTITATLSDLVKKAVDRDDDPDEFKAMRKALTDALALVPSESGDAS